MLGPRPVRDSFSACLDPCNAGTPAFAHDRNNNSSAVQCVLSIIYSTHGTNSLTRKQQRHAVPTSRNRTVRKFRPKPFRWARTRMATDRPPES